MDAELIGRLAYLGLLLAAVGVWVIVEYRGRLGEAMRAAAAWGLIFIGVIAAYGLWQDIHHKLIPSQAVMRDGRVEIPRAPDGHYYVTLDVNGTPVRFMADTGASSVVLTQEDARRLGIDRRKLAYVGEAQTANGAVRTARVRLKTVTLGPFTDAGLGAWVNEGPMPSSLLGMDYLRLFRIEIADERMVLSR